ncbi:MAG: hypothetical protein R3B07_07025 [Polyangiaceae bacterium]
MNMTLRPAFALAFLAILVGVPLFTFGPFWAGLLVLTPAALVLHREFRADPVVASLFTAAVLVLLAAVYAAVLVVFGSGAGIMPPAVLALLVAGTVAALVVWRRSRNPSGGLPDILGERFGREELYERDEVQWTMVQPDPWLTRDSVLEVWLQSCVNAPRVARLSFEEESRKRLGDGWLLYPKPFEVELGPGEVRRCAVPVRPTERHADQLRLYVRVDAKGPVASRNRHYRGHPVEDRVSTTTIVVGAAVGELQWGGGVFVDFKRRVRQPATHDLDLKAVSESIWTPPQNTPS